MTSKITHYFEQKKNTDSDINQHLERLMTLTKECQIVAELGVRDAVSTWAFLEGLKTNGQETKTLICVDINDAPNFDEIIKDSAKEGIDVSFIKGDSAKVDLPYVDLLFIDTWHVYGHLKREFEKHHQNVGKYIALHDTDVDKTRGESVRLGCNIAQQSQETGYPEEEIRKGLQFAIDEFLENNSEWCLFETYSNNNGLTILKRNL